MDGHQSGLRVERVEDRLHQEEIHATFDEGPRLAGVGGLEVIEAESPEGRVVHIGREREGLGCGAHGAGDKARLVGILVGPKVRREACEARGFEIQLTHQMGRAVVALRHGGCVESVGLDQVRAGFEEGLVDFRDHIGPGQDQ